MTSRPDSPAPAEAPPAPASATDATRDLYLAWIGFQRRAVSMQAILGFDLRHLPPPWEPKWLKPFGYLSQARDTARLIRTENYDTVWVQTPPTFLVHLLLALRTRHRFRLIADLHNNALHPPWSRIPGAITLLNRCDLVLVHNAEIVKKAVEMGVEATRLMVLEDPPPPDFHANPATSAAVPAEPYVLVPCSFQYDEPIPVLMEVARAMPELRFLISGNRKRAEAQGFTRDVPDNVTFTGLLDIADFDAVLAGAAVVLGLTTEEGIQLSVANEALGAGRPLVLSETELLRTMFGEAALLSANTGPALAATLKQALARQSELTAASIALRERRLADWVALAPRLRGP